jgi:murein DD-endopeptidase MepM/ murein hydrolase activator NlpD
MPRINLKLPRLAGVIEFAEYLDFLKRYIRLRGYHWFAQFELLKDLIVDLLYKKRGRYARPFLHVGTIGLIFALIILGPIILAGETEEEGAGSSGGVLRQASAFGTSFYTLQAEEVRQFRGGEVIEHTIQEGETASEIAQRYGLDVSTVLWENELTERSKLTPGQQLRILPVDGVRHKVARGETIYSIAKKYGLDDSQAQQIVDYPFNEFLNDETFELTTGQYLIVPQGIKPDPVVRKTVTSTFGRITPDAGAVSASGSFVWPTSGGISQGYAFYHKAIDISNRGGGPILAADSGVVLAAGWDGSGYGNRIIIDHGNGFSTLYAHLSALQVQTGQRVGKGNVIGQMGSTGRSTGVHLHFEIRQGGVLLNPLSFL